MTQDNVQSTLEVVNEDIVQQQKVSIRRLRMIPDGERFRSSQTVESDNIVKVIYSFKRSLNDDQRFEKTSWLDFRTVTKEQLLLLASRSVVIDLQAVLRRLQVTEMMNIATLNRVDVQRDILSATRVKGDPEATSIKILAKKYNMTEADVIKLFERQQESGE